MITPDERASRQLTVMVPEELLERLKREAHARVIGRQLLIRRVIEIGLDHLAPLAELEQL